MVLKWNSNLTVRTSKPRRSRRATHDGVFVKLNDARADSDADSDTDYLPSPSSVPALPTARGDDVGFGKRTSTRNRLYVLALLPILAGLATVLLIQETEAAARPRHRLDDVVDGLRQTMLRGAFVHVDGATFRELLVWQGADPSDLNAIEEGKIHAATQQDKEPTMAFRQIAFHRMVSLEGKPFQPAQYRAITQIADNGEPLRPLYTPHDRLAHTSYYDKSFALSLSGGRNHQP